MPTLLERGFARDGFKLHTQSSVARPDRCLIEVYPHPAIVRLLELDERLPYKVSKSRKFWPAAAVSERKAKLLEGFQRIRLGLLKRVDGIPDFLLRPETLADRSFTFLKRFEDALDALVSAWVAVEHLEGRTTAYGDATASLWVPN